MDEAEWDYVVVGAGAAGSVVAARLSENPAIRVLLVEAGARDSYFPFHIPGLGFLASSRKDDNWWFETEPSPELNGRRQIWLQGKLVGGSSSINGMIYNRGHAREYDYWAQMGCDGWGFDGVLPYFKKSEASQRGDDEWHSRSGAVPIRRSGSALPIYDDFLRACAENGLPTLDDLNRNTVDGFGYYDVNIKDGRRMSAAAAYLGPARGRANLTVLTGAPARRVVFEGRRAVGVEIARRGVVTTVRARREVVLSAGGIKSPQLLMLSGIGPAGHLAAHGIEVLVDAPQVGRNLQNHPSYRMQYACSGRSTAFNYLTPRGMIQSGATYLLSRGGGLGESIFGVGGFFRSRPDLELPDIQVVMCGALLSKPTTDRPTLWQMLPKQQGFALVVYQGTPYSRGSVTLRSADPAAAPAVDSGYFRDPRDIRVLMAGIKRMREVCTGAGKPRYVVQELAPGPAIRTDADLERDIRDNVSTSYHQCGTCAMGGQPSSVVDPRLRVRGVEGLRVADASIIPVMPNAALHGPVMMIGEKAAAMIAEDAALRSGAADRRMSAPTTEAAGAEAIIDPGRPIIDPHHHLWVRPGSRYLLDEFLADTGSGHDIRATVFVQCRTMYRADGPEALKSLGETEFVNGIAAMSASGAFGPTRVAAGIVGHADLMLGAAVEPVLAEHMKRAGDRFRGVRYMLIWDADARVALAGYPMEPHRARDPRFRDGVRTLGRLGLSLDTLVFHPQLDEVAELADSCPDTAIILDHVGLPVGIGPYADDTAGVFARWRGAIRRLAERPNVLMKVGGLGLDWLGLGFRRGDGASSADLARAWRPYVETCIEAFGAERCMFESNFPVDGVAVGYSTLWNAFKRLAADASETEKRALFGGTAARAYRLDVPEFAP